MQTDSALATYVDMADPLGVDHILAAREDWDAQLGEQVDEAELLPIEREALQAIAARQPAEQPEPTEQPELPDATEQPELPETPEVPEQTEPADDQPAETAGEQDHTNPWQYAGEPADAPATAG